eukprot:1053296-Amphidinium_carterae.1
MAAHVLSKTDEKEQLITALLTQSSLIDEILGYTKELFVLDGDAAENLRDAIHQFNILATELRFRFDATMLFHFTVKNHAMCHVAEDCRSFHPRLCWSYTAEDFMQTVRTLAYGCKSIARHRLPATVLRKYTMALEL